MQRHRSFWAVVPARGGSKGVPRKNIKEFLGKPLIAWTIEVAQESGLFDRIIVSTEDQLIAEVGRAHGAEVPFLRPMELAQDTTLTAPVIQYTIEWLMQHEGAAPDYVMILEPTSPARKAFHILESTDLLVESGAESVASIVETPHQYHPKKVLSLHADRTISGSDGTHIKNMIHRRQDLSPCYAFCGLIFGCKVGVLMQRPATLWGERVVGYRVDKRYALDIDTPEDWAVAEARMRDLQMQKRVC